MKKKIIIWAFTCLLIANYTHAQCSYPSLVRQNPLYHGYVDVLEFVWDEIVQGKTGQGQGLPVPGAKRIVYKIDDKDYMNPEEFVTEFYANGLTKSIGWINGSKKLVFNYDKQWRIQNISGNEGEFRKYVYNEHGKLTTSYHESEKYVYHYDANGNLTEILRGNSETYIFKNNHLSEIRTNLEYPYEVFPMTFRYDSNGNCIGSTKIAWDGIDDGALGKNEISIIYNEKGFPGTLINKGGEYNSSKKIYVGKPYVYTYRSRYSYDTKGNWTSWSVANNGVEFTVTRTFEYYSDEEVKVAIAEMELAKSK